MGVMAVFTIPLYVQTFDWMAWLLSALQRNNAGYGLFTAFSHAIALLVMVPTTFLAGMTLPLFTHVLMKSRRGERAIGQVYAANTLGSIVGVLFAVHIGLPMLGLKSLIAFGATLDVLLGVALLYRSGAGREIGAVAKGALVGATALVLVSVAVDLDPKRLASGVYRYSWAELGDDSEMLFYEDGKTASISLARRGGEVVIATNGKPDASLQMNPAEPRSTDEITMIMAGALPLAYKSDAKTVANIGLGSGLTTHTLLADEAIEHVDTVEIEAAMIKAARGFGDRVARTFSDPRSEIHLEDAKTFFSLQNRSYDIIIAEPSNPWVSGVASLFSEEFYRTVPNYLAPDGLLVQWLQLYEFNDRLALSVLQALSQHFSDFAVYNTDSINILIVAKRSGELGRPDFERVLNRALGEELSAVGLHTPADLAVRNTGSKRLFDALLARSSVPANSDYFPFLDLNAGRARFRGQTTTMFVDWSIASLPLLEMIGMEPFDHGDVSLDPLYHRTQRIADARKIFQALVLESDEAAFASPGLHLARSLSRSCASGETDDIRLGSLHTIAMQSLPFLRPGDAVALVDAALPPQCLEQSSARARTWLELYRAIAARDAERMATAGFAASGDETSDANRRQYALGAAMLGALQSAQPNRSISLWEERPAALKDALPSAEIEVVLEIAHRRAQETAAAR
jgi:spermidine synthase